MHAHTHKECGELHRVPQRSTVMKLAKLEEVSGKSP